MRKDKLSIDATAFLFRYQKDDKMVRVIITALHCIRDKKSGLALDRLIGFEISNSMDRYVFQLPDYENWIYDLDRDFAMLPVDVSEDLIVDTPHSFIPSEVMQALIDVPIEQIIEFVAIGFGEGKTAYLESEDIQLKSRWKPIKADLKLKEIDQDKRIIQVYGGTVPGFSGSPLIALRQNIDGSRSLHLLGMLIKMFPENERYVETEEDRYKILVEGGIGLDVNLFWKTIKDKLFIHEEIPALRLHKDNAIKFRIVKTTDE